MHKSKTVVAMSFYILSFIFIWVLKDLKTHFFKIAVLLVVHYYFIALFCFVLFFTSTKLNVQES